MRCWNVFHGNTSPPHARGHLEAMVRLAATGAPAAVCLQEVPVWALGRLGVWSAMTAIGDVAQRPRAGPIPIGAALGRAITALDHGRLRSAFTGQANAILLDARLRVLERHALTLNPLRFRRLQARRLRLDLLERLAWGKERRVCQVVRVRRPEGTTLVLANLHATNNARLAAAEVARAAAHLDAVAERDEVVVLAGDFNLRPALEEWGYSSAGEGIDHVLVRGAAAAPPERWPEERRRDRDGRLLSDHAPVDVEVQLA